MYPARQYKTLEGGLVVCHVCPHVCRIDNGGVGRCGVRRNVEGRLYTEAYEKIAAANIDPVEKKPLYHFLPGHRTFSFGTMGCNLGCGFCQNYTLSQPPREGQPVTGQAATPELLVDAALTNGCKSVAFTYSEPTIFFELVCDVARLAKEKGLATILVSNGFSTPETIKAWDGLIDAANIDLKAFREDFYHRLCQARLAPVLKTIENLHRQGVWIELTTLVIPGENDDPAELREMAAWIKNTLGPDVPWHLSRFHPQYKMMDTPPTDLSTLERAYQIGREAGLNYVYLGNVAGNEHNDTACARCGKVLIERDGFTLVTVPPAGAACPDCGAPLAGVYAP